MSGHLPRVAVVVVTWNSAAYLGDCLDSLVRQHRPPAEVVVVDNASCDGSAGLARAHPIRCTVIDAGANVGFCRANNVGIARTTSPAVLALNPDTRLDPAFLAHLLPALDDPQVGIATGKLLRFDGRTLDSAGQELGRARRPIDRGYGTRDDGRYDRDAETFGACAAAALYRRSMLEQIDLGRGEYFDEAYFAFYEDLDLAWRARRRGWRAVYRHRAVGLHARGGSETERHAWRRLAALLGRAPDVRFHIVKNRYLTLIRNETVAGYVRCFPFIFGRDLATVALLALTSPGVLGRVWRERGLFRQAFARRRLDDLPRGHHFQQGKAG